MKSFKHKFLAALAMASVLPAAMSAQETYTVNDTIYNPRIIFTSSPSQYEIAGIRVVGVDNYDDDIVIGYSGLAVGQRVDIPGDDMQPSVSGVKVCSPRCRSRSRRSIKIRHGWCSTCASSLAFPR